MITAPPVWDGALRRLRAELPAFALEAWLRPLVAEADGPARLRLLCPTAFHRDRVRERLLPAIERCLAAEAGGPVEVEIALGAGPSEPGVERTPARAAIPARGHSRVERRPPEAPRQQALLYSFETFVVGPSNALAREASVALAQGRQQGLSPLFLSAPQGLGKTHLSRAIVAESRARGNQRALYLSAEAFTSEFMRSIRSQQMDRFKRRFRKGCDLLVVEDVQFLASKNATQLELFHTLSHLLDAGARVVLSGDRLPREIEGLDARLASQLASGLVAELEPPEPALRREILRAKASAGGVCLPDDCAELLVEAVPGSLRDLTGALVQLVASASLLGRPIDLELTQEALRKVAPERVPLRRLAVEQVVQVVATFFGTSPEALARRSRRKDVVLPRQLAMYLCRRYTDATLSSVARVFGRDHPAVSHAEKAIERAILERAPLRYKVEELRARLDALAGRPRKPTE
jgi:chromosomal replication initiator protein